MFNLKFIFIIIICAKMTSSGLYFNAISDELKTMVDDIVRQILYDKDYDETQVQSWCYSICDEVVKALEQQQRGFKFICISNISKKGASLPFIGSNCLWNPNQDGSVMIKYESEQMYAFVYLFGIAP